MNLLSPTSEPRAGRSERASFEGRRAPIRFLRPRTPHILVAGIAACIVFSTTSALAATFSESSSGFGANTEVVASCGSGISLGYTTGFSQGLTEYTVDSIDLSNIPAGCLGKNLSLTFYDTAGNDVGLAVNATLPPSGTTETISITPDSNAIDARQVSGVSVVVP